MGGSVRQLTMIERPDKKRSNTHNEVGEERAASLLGVAPNELRRLSAETGLGRQSDNGSERLVFTYAELYRLCRFAVQP